MLDAAGPVVRDHPFQPRPGEAVLRTRVAGVCATDLELVRGYMGFSGVLGHEFVAEVVEGPPAWLGRRVVGEINCACGACPSCRAGRPRHCPQRSVLGILARDGAMAERFSLPVANLHAVPDGVPDEAAVFVEPLAAACRILEQVPVASGDRVAVLGLGRLGWLCAAVLRLHADEVLGLSRSPRRPPPGVGWARPTEVEGGFDLVVDASGQPEGLALATRLVRPEGTVVLKTTTHALPTLSPTAWVVDEIRLLGSRCGPFGPALELLRQGLVDPRPLLAGRHALADGVAALEAAARGGKVLITP